MTGGVYKWATEAMPEPEGVEDGLEGVLAELLESMRWGFLRYLFGEDFGVLSNVKERSGTVDERLMKEFLPESEKRSSLLELR